MVFLYQQPSLLVLRLRHRNDVISAQKARLYLMELNLDIGNYLVQDSYFMMR